MHPVLYILVYMYNGEASKSFSDQSLEKQRKRLEKRRKLAKLASSRRRTTTTTTEMENLSLSNNGTVLEMVPVVGSTSIAGRAREMEDTISVRLNLCKPEANNLQPIHFFAVFDGHGGHEVSALCRDRLHVFLREELMRAGEAISSSTGGVETPVLLSPLELFVSTWERALKNAFFRLDEIAKGNCNCGAVGFHCTCPLDQVWQSGSTAVVAVLTTDYIIVANCGDSRAVLSRGGNAIPLSYDHKPSRPEEKARVEAAGGRIFLHNGLRVEGMLTMTRALGDRYLKPYVSGEPEITFTKRLPNDDCLILASDGVWDVITNGTACDLAKHCLDEDMPVGGKIRGVRFESRSAAAASVIIRLALGRDSIDNVSGIVVDLKRVQTSSV